MVSPVREISPGVITAFSGGIGNIPPGWHLCDGTNGTPDLRDRFVPATGPTFSVGDEGGAKAHNHDFTADGHFHEMPSDADIQTLGGVHHLTTTVPLTGTTGPTDNHPPYYALSYIMYLGG